MINVIFTLGLIEPITQEVRTQFENLGCTWVPELPETRIINGVMLVQAYVPEELFEPVKQQLDALDIRGYVEVVGAWGIATGAQEGVFDSALYAEYLNDINEYDENGVIISSRRPTMEEALATQVNSFSGMPPRDLLGLIPGT